MGRVMPVGGINPTFTLIWTNAWKVIIDVIEHMNSLLKPASVLSASLNPEYAKSANPNMTGSTPMNPTASVNDAKAESLYESGR